MAYKPILFNTEMVQAIQAGRKTQTRRIIKLTPGFSGRPVGESGNPDNPLGFMYPCGIKRPPCNKGDILWVRETWRPIEASSAGWCRIEYKAGGTEDFKKVIAVPMYQEPWHPSIHMPKEAARIFLRVKDVRVERLRDMGYSDLANEGFGGWDRFISLWDSTIKPADRDKYGWNADPWVWVIEFERCEKPEGWY